MHSEMVGYCPLGIAVFLNRLRDLPVTLLFILSVLKANKILSRAGLCAYRWLLGISGMFLCFLR